MNKQIAAALTLLLVTATAFGASAILAKGEALYAENKPRDAQPLLEQALSEDPSNEQAYLYLGIVYQQLGNPAKAIDVLKRGLAVASEHKDLFYYNMGNDYFAQRQFTFAEEMYTNALFANQDLSDGYLNRANARLQLANLDGALSDYTIFLQLDPQDVQRPRIEQVMRLIQQALDQKAQAAAAEAARQKALLDDATNSLNNAGENARNLSVESINAQTDPVDVDIKD
jgi:tetratricopeptide (TPR) repeat protein